ncbi:MAG: nitroreductase [Syntrophales bacterium]|nr:nitroreductase [Syntrophales bacterium]
MLTVEEAILKRRSIRRFKPNPVERSQLEKILDLARWSPSWGNTQPWHFFVFQGDPLRMLKDEMSRRITEGKPFEPDVPMPNSWPESLKNRYSETGKLVLSALSIAREDHQRRQEFYFEMSRLFGAPCLIVGTVPRDVAIEYAMLDMGIIIQSICLAAHSNGLATCIMAASVGYPDIIRQIGRVETNLRIVMGIALGYEEESPVNQFPRPRIPLTEMVTWVD